MYILQCADGSYYTGSTNNLELRLAQHQTGEGANHTKKRLPVKLVYYEEYQRIDEAFYREKQVQGWRREKKEALIRGDYNLLPELAIAYRDLDTVASSASATEEIPLPEVLEGSTDTVASGASATESASATEEITLPEVLEGSTDTVASGASATESASATEEIPLPEVLEGSTDTVASSTSATESASATEEITLPEALEGSVKKTLEGSEKAVSSRASETAKTRASETAKTKTRKK